MTVTELPQLAMTESKRIHLSPRCRPIANYASPGAGQPGIRSDAPINQICRPQLRVPS